MSERMISSKANTEILDCEQSTNAQQKSNSDS